MLDMDKNYKLNENGMVTVSMPDIPIERYMFWKAELKRQMADTYACPICEAEKEAAEVTRFDLLDFD
jgi:hypothetical protein